jgi:hypothetical protein
VPNARHISLFRDLFLRGTFGYSAEGHRDSTHLRWFTRRDIVALVGESGWTVGRIDASSLRPPRQALSTISAGRLREFLALQWFVLARA